MNIYYNDKNSKWERDYPESVSLGKNLLPVVGRNTVSGSGFRMRNSGGKVGPLIAILTSKETYSDFYGNRPLFKRIQRYLAKHGGISFVMTPEGLNGETIEGYVFTDDEWKKMLFPLPDIIYNRVASYKAERGKAVARVRALATKHSIPFYNPHFFEKWETYNQLCVTQDLVKYLPKTDVLTNKSQLHTWLQQYQSVIIKPTLSNRGEGIVVITKKDEGYEIQSNDERNSYECLEDVWIEFQKHLKRKKFIIQQKISLQQFEGRPYDFRILVQRVSDQWSVTGIGVRCAGTNAITTHVPKGGKVIGLDEISAQLDLGKANDIANSVARQLERAYGYLCEFSLDLGIDQEDRIWLFEVNSKPMKFDEVGIREKALHTLMQCFYDDADFR